MSGAAPTPASPLPARADAGGRTVAQWFCLLGGAALILRGAVGVALDPQFDTPAEGWHQLFHFLSGVLLIACAGAPGSAFAMTVAFAVTYGAITLAGIVDGTDVAGVIPVEASDNVVHTSFTLAATAVLVATFARRPRPST